MKPSLPNKNKKEKKRKRNPWARDEEESQRETEESAKKKAIKHARSSREESSETAILSRSSLAAHEKTKHKHTAIPCTPNYLHATTSPAKTLPFPHKYILAPMVGASELAFRLLCRQYGTQLAYTPMMAADKFAHDATYRAQEFQTCQLDRPLVCHFCANTPQDFAAAAQLAAPYCDAIDLNLGCPQRTAYLGHFGSYLLDDKDRQLVCSMIRAAVAAVDKPIFAKIRLLDSLSATIELCGQLQEAGASLIAVHARYRASWERKGPGARDGPALLDQVAEIKKHVRIPIISNGNTITYDDVEQNLSMTGADGLMSAEGILDNPALFLPRWGEQSNNMRVPVIVPETTLSSSAGDEKSKTDAAMQKKERKLQKKLREICRIEEKVRKKIGLTDEEEEKLAKKETTERKLTALSDTQQRQSKEISLSDLHKVANNKLVLANQYLDLATKYPVKIRSVVFHTRRMLKDLLGQYQLLEACLVAESISDVRQILHKIQGYQHNPATFVFDKEKEKAQNEALERKKREEGKRKAYEARMIRKAKREGRRDLQHYLHQGAAVPSKALVQELRQLTRDKALSVWKEKHSQHCLAFHLDSKGCTRGRACAFLHVDVLTSNSFNEQDEVAG